MHSLVQTQRSWHSCSRQATKTHPASTIHDNDRMCDYLNGWTKKRSHAKISPKMVNPRNLAGNAEEEEEEEKSASRIRFSDLVTPVQSSWSAAYYATHNFIQRTSNTAKNTGVGLPHVQMLTFQSASQPDDCCTVTSWSYETGSLLRNNRTAWSPHPIAARMHANEGKWIYPAKTMSECLAFLKLQVAL